MGTSQGSTFFKLEEAKLLPVLGMPAGSVAPKQLSRGSGLQQGIIQTDSKLLTPAGIRIRFASKAKGVGASQTRPFGQHDGRGV